MHTFASEGMPLLSEVNAVLDKMRFVREVDYQEEVYDLTSVCQSSDLKYMTATENCTA